MKPNKNISKIRLNKSDYPKSKSKSKVKTSLSQNKSSYNISQYIKNRNELILSYDKNSKIEDSSYIKDEKEKLIESYKNKLEKEKLINKNLWHELNEYKSAMNKTRENYNKIMNKKQTKNEELIIITNKLTKLIEMVINFSYSMAYLRSNIYSKNKRRFNESTLAYESLNNNLKQIYNEFEQMNKNLKKLKDINSKPRISSKSPIKLDKNVKTEINDRENSDKKEKINDSKINLSNNHNSNKKIELKIDRNNNFEFKSIYPINTQIKENSLKKEKNSKDIDDENKNISSIKNVISSNLFPKLEKESTNENNIYNNIINYKKINNIPQIKERESLKTEENKEASVKNSINRNSDKIFTFRNNSQISKDGSEKINLGNSSQHLDINNDINKLIEENKELKMQLASEKLKSNNTINNSLNESHNDEEYEEIISELKKKMEEKDNIITDLKKKLESNQVTNNNIYNEYQNKNEKEKIFNNINVNVNLTEMDKIKGNYQENINKKKENLRISLIKINELEKEKISLLAEIKNFNGL